MQPIYLDHNATTPLLPEAAEAMTECQSAGFANPESQHQLGRRARRLLEDAREGIGEILGADLNGRQPDRLIFTSGGTEANNLALLGISGALSVSSPSSPSPLAGESRGEGSIRPPEPAHPRIIISPIEHPSVTQPAEFLARHGWRLDRLAVSPIGVVRLEHFESLLAARPRLASVMLANNETGVIQPVRELAALASAAGVPLHTDAVQAVGKMPVNFRELGIAAMTIAAHKFHGPRGIGALVVRGGKELDPLLFGGFQQQGLRPGTEPVTLAVGMHMALSVFEREEADRRERITRLRDRLERALLAAWPSAVIHGATAPRLPNTTCIAFPGLDRQALVMALDMAGIACSTGSACASGSSEPSPTLLAMGLPSELIGSSIRFSLGTTTTPGQIDDALGRIDAVVRTLRNSVPAGHALGA